MGFKLLKFIKSLPMKGFVSRVRECINMPPKNPEPPSLSSLACSSGRNPASRTFTFLFLLSLMGLFVAFVNLAAYGLISKCVTSAYDTMVAKLQKDNDESNLLNKIEESKEQIV